MTYRGAGRRGRRRDQRELKEDMTEERKRFIKMTTPCSKGINISTAKLGLSYIFLL